MDRFADTGQPGNTSQRNDNLQAFHRRAYPGTAIHRELNRITQSDQPPRDQSVRRTADEYMHLGQVITNAYPETQSNVVVYNERTQQHENRQVHKGFPPTTDQQELIKRGQMYHAMHLNMDDHVLKIQRDDSESLLISHMRAKGVSPSRDSR